MIKPPFRSWADVRNAWKTLAGYERFEVVVALLLRGVIGIIIVVALYRLIAGVVDTILWRALNPLDHAVFHQVFGAIMTLLIALEFNHTLRYVAPGARGTGLSCPHRGQRFQHVFHHDGRAAQIDVSFGDI